MSDGNLQGNSGGQRKRLRYESAQRMVGSRAIWLLSNLLQLRATTGSDGAAEVTFRYKNWSQR